MQLNFLKQQPGKEKIWHDVYVRRRRCYLLELSSKKRAFLSLKRSTILAYQVFVRQLLRLVVTHVSVVGHYCLVLRVKYYYLALASFHVFFFTTSSTICGCVLKGGTTENLICGYFFCSCSISKGISRL